MSALTTNQITCRKLLLSHDLILSSEAELGFTENGRVTQPAESGIVGY